MEKWEETKDILDEEQDSGSGITLSGEQIISFSQDPDDVPDGDYLGELSKYRWIPPKEGRAGGFRVWFKIIDSDNPEPEDGWPEINHFFRVKYEAPTEGQKKVVKFDMRAMSAMLIALLGSLEGEKSLDEWLEDALGCQCYFNVFHEEWNGRKYKKIRSFRAAE